MSKLLLLFGLAMGCHHEDAPQPKLEPGEKLPLPPSSGTPIGFLLDDASDLSLKPEQVAQLQGIDQALQAKLEKLDRAGEHAGQPASAPPQGGGRRRGGGRHGGGGGGMQQQQAPQGHVNNAPGAGSGSPQQAQLESERRGDVKDALDKAFALMDVPQRVLARKVLAEHDVDLDGGAKPPTQGGNPDGDPVEGEP